MTQNKSCKSRPHWLKLVDDFDGVVAVLILLYMFSENVYPSIDGKAFVIRMIVESGIGFGFALGGVRCGGRVGKVFGGGVGLFFGILILCMFGDALHPSKDTLYLWTGVHVREE